MGRAIKDTKVQVGGQAGPLGKGMPLSKAAGPGANGFGGISGRFKQAAAQKGFGKPQKTSMFGRMFAGNPEIQKKIQTAFQAKQQRQKYGGLGGRFRQWYDQNKQGNPGALVPPGQQPPAGVQPTQQPVPISQPPTGGLVSKEPVNKPKFGSGSQGAQFSNV